MQKVLQNLHVYRSRLAPRTVRGMTADLARGTTGDGLNIASTSPPPPASKAGATKCAKASIADTISSCD